MSTKDVKSKSILEGSDSVIECPCMSCEKDGTIEEATRYCQDCKQFLCPTCTKYHTRFSATAGHTLSEAALAQKQTRNIQSVPAAKCLTHPERDIEMYCDNHDMVYCSLCIAKDHRSCTSVTEVGDIAHLKQDQSKLKQLLEDIDDVCKKLSLAKKRKTDNIEKLKDLKQQILSEIHAVRQKIRKHLDNLEEKTTTELDDLCFKLESELLTEVASLESMSSSAVKRKETLSKSMETNVEQTFIHEKLGEKFLIESNLLLETKNIVCEKKMIFCPDKLLWETLMAAASFGYLRKPGDNLRVKSKKEIDVKVEDDTKEFCISDFCQLPDGTILVTDQLNKKVKRLDSQYNVKDYCQFNSEVVSLTYSADTKAVIVKLKPDRAEFLTVGTQFQKVKTVSLKGGGNFGLLSCRGQLWVSSGCGIDICDMSGDIIKRIETNADGKKIFSKLVNHITISSDAKTVYAAAWDIGVVSFDHSGNIKKHLKDERLRNTHGVAVSYDGTLYVSGFSSNNIVMFSPDGTCLGELVGAGDGMTSPYALHYDQIKNQLFVSFADSKISVLELGE